MLVSEWASFQTVVQPASSSAALSSCTSNQDADADHLPGPGLAFSQVPSTFREPPIGPPTIPAFSCAPTNPLSKDNHLRKSEPFALAMRTAAKSMCACVRFSSSKLRHSMDPQSCQFVTGGSKPASVMVGWVSTDSFAMNPLKISARLITPSVCNSVTSLMNGFMYSPRTWFRIISCFMSISLSTVRLRIPPSIAVIPSHFSAVGTISSASAKFDQSGLPSSVNGTGTGVEPTIEGSLTLTTNPRIISVVVNSSLIIRSAVNSGDSIS